jgi:hypothetical protein
MDCFAVYSTSEDIMDDHPSSENTALIAEMNAAYEQFNAYLDTLTEYQLIYRTDAAGWTGKDHIIHLARWAESMVAVLDKQPRWDALGVSVEIWRTIEDGYDQINAAIQQQNRDMPLVAVRAELAKAHQAVVDKVASVTAADLERPYAYYQSWATGENSPVRLYLHGNTVDHYSEHWTYIDAIVKQK